jgi:hypothetical protein
MNETLTIRLPRAQRQALRARASATGRTESEVVRELISGQLQQRGTIGDRAGRHLGRLSFAPTEGDNDPWRASLRRMNHRA